MLPPSSTAAAVAAASAAVFTLRARLRALGLTLQRYSADTLRTASVSNSAEPFSQNTAKSSHTAIKVSAITPPLVSLFTHTLEVYNTRITLPVPGLLKSTRP